MQFLCGVINSNMFCHHFSYPPALHFIGWPVIVAPWHFGCTEDKAEYEAEEYR